MSVRVVRTIADLRETVRAYKAAGRSIAFVPTMGALHRGHTRLIETARKDSDVVVVSIFVNPTQFNQAEDYQRYPRTLDADVAACERSGADIVFAPSVEEMYPEPVLTSVEVAKISEGLCGEYRPGHFRGVATVVTKLLNIVQPDRAYFGEKDAQQLAVITRMVRDLNIPVEIVPVETVREADGLAMSSRNTHLSAAERRAAPVLYRALRVAADHIRGGRDVQEARRAALDVLAGEPLVRVEYLEVVGATDMQPVKSAGGPMIVAAAIWLGNTRLIDNVRVDLSAH